MAMQYYVSDSDEFDLDDVEIDLFNNEYAKPTHLYHKPLSVVSAQWTLDNGSMVDVQVQKNVARVTIKNSESTTDGNWTYTPEQYQKMLDDIDRALADLYV